MVPTTVVTYFYGSRHERRVSAMKLQRKVPHALISVREAARPLLSQLCLFSHNPRTH